MSIDKPKFKQMVFSYFNRPPSPALKCTDASLTRQEFVKDADLNNIMARYAAGMGPIPSGDRTPMFGDFSNLPDYQHSLQIVIDAQAKFDSLPARVRERFGNDPAQLLDFLGNVDNRNEAISLGLIDKPVANPDEASKDVSVPPDQGGANK